MVWHSPINRGLLALPEMPVLVTDGPRRAWGRGLGAAIRGSAKSQEVREMTGKLPQFTGA